MVITSTQITMFRETFQQFLSQTHPIPTSHLILIETFVLSSNQYGAAVSTVTRIHIGRFGVQILEVATELSLLQNIQTSTSNPPPPQPPTQ
jgi:hypothetical protein